MAEELYFEDFYIGQRFHSTGSAKVTAEVVVFGKQEYLEVANREMFEAELSKAPLSVEDQAALADLGL